MQMATVIPYPLELTTDRLMIRFPAVADAQDMREAIAESLDALKPWMPWADHLPTIEEAEANCARAAQEFKDAKDFRLHLFLRDSDAFVGGSGLHNADWSTPKFEIGYWVRQSCSGNGYIAEAVAEIARFALEELTAKRVESRTSARNVRSWRVAERLGFTLDGVLRNDTRHLDGSLRDTKVYSMVAMRPQE